MGVDSLPTLPIENRFHLFTNASSVCNLWNDSHIFSRLILCTWLLNPTQPSSSGMRLPAKELRSLGLGSWYHFCSLFASVRASIASLEPILNPGSSIMAWMTSLNIDTGSTLIKLSWHSTNINYRNWYEACIDIQCLPWVVRVEEVAIPGPLIWV